MHDVEPRRVLAPETKITTNNKREAGHMNTTKNIKASGRKPTSTAVGARMPATSRIPVSRTVWAELSSLKTAGQTFSQLLEEMIEDRKKARFFRDMEKLEEEGDFVEFPW